MSRKIRVVRRSLVVLPFAAALIGAAGAGGSQTATSWFGSSLNHEPANAGSTCSPPGSALVQCTRAGSYYPGTSGRAKSPVNGTIVSFRVRAESATTIKFRLVRLRNLSPDHRTGQAKLLATGPTVKVKGSTSENEYPVETFKVHMKVQKGDSLAIDTAKNTVEYCSDGTPGQLRFRPALKLNGRFRHSSSVDGCLLLVQAVVKRG